MCDYVFILLSALQIMRFNFTDISSSQKDIHQTHTKCQISYDTYWYWCTFSIPLIFFFTVSTMCVKTILRERLLLFSINYYLSNWPLSSTITNAEIRFIAWVKLKMACNDWKYTSGRDEIKYVLFVYSYIVYAKTSKHRAALYNFLYILKLLLKCQMHYSTFL